jgi:hypothetical protein
VSDGVVAFEPPENEAWIVSSGAEEQSFEADDRRGALFTHYFLSGARGAADADGDHRITLGELYRFVQVHTIAAAATLGRDQEPRWAGTLGGWTLTDLSASASGVRIAGPRDEPLLVIDVRRGWVQAEVPSGTSASLALAPGHYQVVELGGGDRMGGHLHVPDDGWVLWNSDARLDHLPAVRTRGGTYDTRPWGFGVGYQAVNGLPGTGHGATLVVSRNLGRGHRIEVAGAGARLHMQDDLWISTTTAFDLTARWSLEVVGKRWSVAPVLGVGPEIQCNDSARSNHPLWDDWYGTVTQAASSVDWFLAGEAGVALRAPIHGAVSAEVLAAGGVAWGLTSSTPKLAPRANLQLTVRGAFR